MGYTYPFDSSWTKEEVIDVVHFFSLIEKAFEVGIDRELLLAGYKKFKQVVPSKSEEKQFFAEFEKESGYSSFQAIKKAREGSGRIKV